MHPMGTIHAFFVALGFFPAAPSAAARIESVCHGGQIGVSKAIHDELNGAFPARGIFWNNAVVSLAMKVFCWLSKFVLR